MEDPSLANDGKSGGDEDMMRLLGFSGFDSTKVWVRARARARVEDWVVDGWTYGVRVWVCVARLIGVEDSFVLSTDRCLRLSVSMFLSAHLTTCVF